MSGRSAIGGLPSIASVRAMTRVSDRALIAGDGPRVWELLDVDGDLEKNPRKVGRFPQPAVSRTGRHRTGILADKSSQRRLRLVVS